MPIQFLLVNAGNQSKLPAELCFLRDVIDIAVTTPLLKTVPELTRSVPL